MFEPYKTEKTIIKFIEANNNRNKIKFIALFTRDAKVIAEGKHYKGIDAIKMWRKKINTLPDFKLEIIGGSKIAEGVMLDLLRTDDLSKSQSIIQHHFIIRNNLIAYLKLTNITTC